MRVAKHFSPLSCAIDGAGSKNLATQHSALLLLRRRRQERGLGGEVILLALLFLAACIPRELPPQLAYTPGPPYTLDGRTLVTDIYTVETPDGWRVIAGPAEDPYTFQFVAPEDDALIVLSGHAIAEPPQPMNADASTLAAEHVEALAGETPLYAVLVAPEGEIRTYRPLLDALIGSIR
jgi:hypothetical protein